MAMAKQLGGLRLLVAANERSLIAALEARKPLPFTLELKGTNELPTGDMELVRDIQTSAPEEVGCDNVEQKLFTQTLVLAERKTKADMIASRKGERYEEQKSRMLDVQKRFPQAKVGFLIEHDTAGKSQSDTDLLHIMTSLICKYSFFCLQTSGPIASAIAIIDMAKKCEYTPQNDEITLLMGGSAKPTLKRKSDYCAANVLAHQLRLVPGVSPAVAVAITRQYATPSSLWNAWQTTEKPQALLEPIVISKTTKGSDRKVGAKLSKAIYAWTTGIEAIE